MRAPIFMLLAPCLCLCSAGQGSSGNPPDPFGAGQRWSHAAAPEQAWIPRDLSFVGSGEFLWAAPAHATPMLQLFASDALSPPNASLEPLFVEGNLGAPTGPILVAAGEDSTRLFAALQYTVAGGSLRRTVLLSYDAQTAARGAAFVPAWSSDLAQLGNGPAALAACPDASRVLLAAFDANLGQIQLMLMDGTNGASLLELSMPASGLGKLALSDDGLLLLVETGAGFCVLDADGQMLFSRQAPELTSRPSLSGDGSILAVGGVGALELYSNSGLGYTLLRRMNAGNSELCTALELSQDGSTLACGWWDFSNGFDIRIEVFDVPSGQLLNSVAQMGSSSGLQNYPVALALTPDGGRIAVGLWGTGDARPEALLLQRARAQPLLTQDLEGSVYAIDLDPSGTRLAVGLKDTHANLLSALGRLALFDTGERDLQLVDAVQIGGQAAARFLPTTATGALFIFGHPLAAPLLLKQGALLIDPGKPYVALQGQTQADSSYAAVLQVPVNLSLVGINFGVQGLALGAPGLRLSTVMAAVEML